LLEFVYLALILDASSRRVIGWALDRTLEAELTLRALHRALQRRRPPAGLVHHSDRGVPYASRAYTELLQQHGIPVSMSAKANPWDNAACESFIKTLKYEDVYRQEYRDLADAQASIERFLEKVYNEKRLHSALGYVPPGRVRARSAGSNPKGSRFAASFLMSFRRHGEIYRSDERQAGPLPGRPLHHSPRPPQPHRLDEFPAGYSWAGCSPAEPASASPAGAHLARKRLRCTIKFQRTANSVLTVCLTSGDNPSITLHRLSPPIRR